MPPRKSNVSAASPEEGAETTPAKAAKEGMSVEDLSLPKSMIARLAKGVLPANTQIHKDALLALHKSATVFVSYIASNSNENAQASGKKTISPQDVMAAMKECEFESFLPRLELELQKYNEVQCDKRNTYRRKVKEEKAAAASKDGDEAPKEGEPADAVNGAANGATNGHVEIHDDEDRPVKKFKADDGTAVVPDTSGLEDDDMDGDEAEADIEGQPDDDDLDDDGDDEADAEDDEVEDEDDDEQAATGFVHDPEADERAVAQQMRDEALDQDSDSE